MQSFTIKTTATCQMVSITHLARQALAQSGVQNGLCTVFCPHTTAGITINENADPDVVRDLLFALEKAYPAHPQFRHFEGNSAAHAKALATGHSTGIPVQGGQLVLGRWQDIYLCEFDGPRGHTVHIQVLGQ